MSVASPQSKSDESVLSDPPMSPRNEKKAHALGLTSATGLVIGSIVGTGVFTMPAVHRRRRHHGDHRPRRHRRGRHAPGRPVRPAHQAGAQQRRRAVRLLPPRVRRLRRLPGRLVLLDPVVGRQRRHRLVLGLLRRRPVRLGPHQRHGELGHRHGRPVGSGHHQPGRDPPDGLVPERHRRPQVPAPAVRRGHRLVLRPERPLRRRSTPRAGASTAASGSPPEWPSSPSSGSRRRP